MGETTGISWSHATLNFWIGCTKVGVACDWCYAETWGNRFGVAWGVGEPRRHTVHNRAKALKLERLAVESGAPFYCFSNSLSDIFDKEVPIEWLAEAFEDMRAAPHVTFILLTKRPGLIVKRARLAGGLPPNVALGCTVVTQAEADRELPKLKRAADALRPVLALVSMEPLVEGVDMRHHLAQGFLGWVITGGESGTHARPTHPDWLRSIRDQCAAAGVPYHHKQNGEWLAGHQYTPELQAADNDDVFSRFDCMDWDGDEAVQADEFDLGEHAVYRVGKKHSGRLLDGVLHDAMPVRS